VVLISKPDIGTSPNDGTGTVWRTAWSQVETALGLLEDHLNDVTGNPHSISESGLSVVHEQGKTLLSPGASEDETIFYTSRAITISQMSAILVGGTSPSVTWTIRHHSDRSNVGIEVVTGGSATTNESTADIVTVMNDATIPANSHVWIETTASSGSPGELTVTLKWTAD
jgi:hypothetical protein